MSGQDISLRESFAKKINMLRNVECMINMKNAQCQK